MKTRLASLVAVLATTSPLFSATEVERLRALCAEQEMQIRQLEEKIARLSDTPPPSRAAAPAEAQAGNQQPAAGKAGNYTVQAGDSMERIARKHGTTAGALAKLNGLKAGSIIHPGQKLKVPGKAEVASAPSSPAAKESRTHTVEPGETFYRIALKYGVSTDDLTKANPGVDPRALKVGQKIKIEQPAVSVAKSAPSLSPAPSTPILNNPAPVEKPRASETPVRIEKEITYGQFAAKHNTTTRRLDELNGLELDPSTVLAQGSELYIPAQP